LNTIGKVIEAITAKAICNLAEQHSMLPKEQMSARKRQSTETAVSLLLAQICTVWKQLDTVLTVLSLNISEAFDRVYKERLDQILRAKGIPRYLAGWMNSFMSDRRTTLVIEDQESALFNVIMNILQSLSLSPILFLFYNAELLDICNANPSTAGVDFVDNVNILIYSTTTEENCRQLAALHERLEGWARQHDMVFAPEKYELMHFSRRHNIDLTVSFNLAAQQIKPMQAMTVLGVWLDPKLRWKAHLDAVTGKMKKQLNALKHITASTWGFPLSKSCKVYTMVIQPVLTYSAIAWHQPNVKQITGLASKMALMQNERLCRVARVYKATSISTLEVETFMAPLNLHLDAQVARSIERMKASGLAREVKHACTSIWRQLLRRGQNTCRPVEQLVHPKSLAANWAKEWAARGSQQSTRPPNAAPSHAALTKRAVLHQWRLRWRPGNPPGARCTPTSQTGGCFSPQRLYESAQLHPHLATVRKNRSRKLLEQEKHAGLPHAQMRVRAPV
jgi:hypothetical protein